MAYCPKCKLEYEEHVKTCADCHIDLVDDLTISVLMKPLIQVKKEELDEMIKYLEYSGISKIDTEDSKDGVLISVPEESYELAMTYLRVYVHEHMEETNEDDYFIDEYETEVVDVDAKVSDMKSTVYTFGFVGALILAVAVLNYVDIVSLSGFNKTMITMVLGVLGLGFVGIAFKTAGDIGNAASEGDEKERQIDNIYNWYKDEKNFETFYKRHKIKKDEVDEGALYFFVYDILKKEVKKQYPDVDEVHINAAVEKIYDEL